MRPYVSLKLEIGEVIFRYKFLLSLTFFQNVVIDFSLTVEKLSGEENEIIYNIKINYIIFFFTLLY